MQSRSDSNTPLSEPASFLLEALFGLIHGGDRQRHFNDLVISGHVAPDLQNRWIASLQEPECAPLLVGYQLAHFKAKLDNLIHQQSIGPIASTRYPDVIRRIQESLQNSAYPGLELSWIQNKSIVDFGSGTYNPLALAIIFYANGFDHVVAIERFPVHVEVAYAGALEIAKCLLAQPGQLNFSGIDSRALKQRVATISFDSLREDLAKFNAGEIRMLNLGGIEFHKSLEYLTSFRFDLLISNSVLEHVAALNTEISLQRRLVADEGLCIHTVDYSDHRAIGRHLNIFGMYYDGELNGINGMRPSELVEILMRSGFSVEPFGQLNVGRGYIDRSRIIDRYRSFTDDELATWVCTYLLRPT